MSDRRDRLDPEGILHALSTATPGNFTRLAQQFVTKWSKLTGLPTRVGTASREFIVGFTSRLPRLFLRGFESAHCFLLPPFLDAEITTRAILTGGTSLGVPTDTLPIIVCVDEMQLAEASAAVPPGRAVLLSPNDIGDLMSRDVDHTCLVFRQLVLAQIPVLRVHPFDTTQPTFGDMFVGRSHELSQLQHQTNDWFLINGPSRVGKTSLQAQYKHQLRRNLDPRLSRQFYVNLLSCAGKGKDEIARHFATSFRENKYTSEELQFTDLRSFLFSVLETVGGALEIIIDEADAVCDHGGPILHTLAEFAIASHSRLIIIGRGKVRQLWRHSMASPLGRMRDMRLQPLSAEESWQLFAHPLEALGFSLPNPETLRSLVIRNSSKMPHLIQALARGCIEMAVQGDTRLITPGLLNRGPDTLLDYGLLRNHLNDLATPEARLVACTILQRQMENLSSVDRIQTILSQLGFFRNLDQVTDICDDLVINCLLSWLDSGYGPPRWDILETAKRNPRFLLDLQHECQALIS